MKKYKMWLNRRKDTADEYGKICYCGHTDRCRCANPDLNLFKESIKRGVLDPSNPSNGWTKMD